MIYSRMERRKKPQVIKNENQLAHVEAARAKTAKTKEEIEANDPTFKDMTDEKHSGSYREWMFTVNNYTPEDYEMLKGHKDNLNIKILVVGKEIGEKEKTPHLQGYAYLQNKPAMAGAKKALFNNTKHKVWLRPIAAEYRFNTVKYCQKGSQPKAEWKAHKWGGPSYGIGFEGFIYGEENLKTKDSPYKACMDDILAGKKEEELMKDHPEMMIKHRSNIVAMANKVKHITDMDSVLKSYENVVWRPWQSKLLELVKKKPDSRRIIWYHDASGDQGKSYVAKYIQCLYKDEAIILTNGKTADLAYTISNQRIVMFNFTKTMEERTNYQAIEEIKDGMVFSGKYESKVKIMNIPHVIVFANFPPEEKKMGINRWHVVHLHSSRKNDTAGSDDNGAIHEHINVDKEETALSKLTADEEYLED